MTERVSKSNLSEYEAFVKGHPKGHFMQSFDWGRLKSGWKWEAVVSRGEDKKIRGSIAVLIRKAGPFSIMYAGRAPVCDVHNPEIMRELFEALRPLAKEHRAYVLKIDPDIPSDDNEFLEIMKQNGLVLLDSGSKFDAVQPKYVFRLNVGGKTLDEVIAHYNSKTRYNLRLAIKQGVTVTIENQKGLDAFSDLMLTTGVRDSFVTRPKAYFARMLECMGENARLYIAWYEDKPIAGSLAIKYGDKVWYLYGASANEYRNAMPNYLLQTEMIKWAVEEGCNIYDFRGVPGDVGEDHPLFGLVRFKRGFGGEYTEFAGEFEYRYLPAIERMMSLAIAIYKKARTRFLLSANRNKEESV